MVMTWIVIAIYIGTDVACLQFSVYFRFYAFHATTPGNESTVEIIMLSHHCPADMTIDLPPSISLYGNEKIAKEVLTEIWGKRGIFTCTVANTLTSTIPGISEAGDTPELTLCTGPADGEFLVCGKTLCMDGLPINPGGIPTPATLTKAALELSDMPCFVINGGCKVMPKAPLYDIGGKYGEKITSGHSVSNVKEVFEKGKKLGRELAKKNDYIVVSESCAGGTTTALAVMMSMGVIRENLVSSSSPNNPKTLKTNLVNEALRNSGIEIGDLRHDPLKAIECVGDPMMPVNIGMILGASETVPVIVGGGTQMSAVIACAYEMKPEIVGRTIHGTTRWLVNDKNSSVCKINDSITNDIPIAYVNVDYSNSPYEGLRMYEKGFIKEGVGCGGSSIAAIASSEGRIDCEMLVNKVHEIYGKIMGL